MDNVLQELLRVICIYMYLDDIPITGQTEGRVFGGHEACFRDYNNEFARTNVHL